MNIFDLTTQQLKRAASIKEQIDRLNGELAKLLGGENTNGAGTQNGRLRLGTRRRIAATQKARWAKVRKAKARNSTSKAAVKKSKMSAAARAKVSARMKAYWAAKRSSKKKSSKQ